MPVDELNGFLMSVGYVCDKGKIEEFTKNEAMILNLLVYGYQKRNRHSRST